MRILVHHLRMPKSLPLPEATKMDNTVALLSLLYELSLSTHKYLDPEETARKFIKKFLSRKSFEYGAVWRMTSGDLDGIYFNRIYSIPQLPSFVSMAAADYKRLFESSDFQVIQGSLCREVAVEGTFAYFKLGDFGILELHRAQPGDLDSFRESLYPFQDVIHQLGTSLSSSLAYQMLQDEIVQRETAEQSLAAAEEKYRRIINNIHLGLLEVDRNEIIQYANEPFIELFGYSLDELVGQKASELLLDEQARQIVARHNADREKGLSGAYEVPVRDKQGNKRWAIISGAPNYDSRGNVIGSIGIHLDITDQKKLQDENAFKGTQLQKLFEKSLDALITINQRGEIIEWSPQAEAIFDYKAEEIAGRRLTETIVPHGFREAHDAGMDKYLATGEGPVLNQRIEITAIKRDGTEFPIELTVFPLKYQEEHYFTAFVRDISELKASKENMEKALKRQKELNDLKSKFISMTSHELRTPLTTIRSNTELASYHIGMDKPLDRDKFRKYVSRIDDNVDRLNQLVSNILTIGKLDTKKFPFNPVPTNLQDFLIEEVIPSFKARGQIVPFNFEGDAFDVNIDKTLLMHVFTNLIENAIKYTPDGKMPSIEGYYDPDQVHIKVIDEGIGIPSADLEQLFDAFYRAGNVDNVSGSGLGLAIVKEFVHLHSGKIDVASVVDQGSTFTISLPRISVN